MVNPGTKEGYKLGRILKIPSYNKLLSVSEGGEAQWGENVKLPVVKYGLHLGIRQGENQEEDSVCTVRLSAKSGIATNIYALGTGKSGGGKKLLFRHRKYGGFVQ